MYQVWMCLLQGRGPGQDTRAFAAALPSEGETDQDDRVPFSHIAHGRGPFFRELRTMLGIHVQSWKRPPVAALPDGQKQ